MWKKTLMQKKLSKAKSQMQQHDFNNRIKKRGDGGGGSVESPSIGMLNCGGGGWGGAYRGVATGRAERVKCWSSELSTVADGDLGRGFAALAAASLHLLYHIHPLNHSPEHHVLPIEPAGRNSELCFRTNAAYSKKN